MLSRAEARSSKTQRTYYVNGYRVEQTRHAHGQSSWACDCAEFLRGQSHGAEAACVHSQRVAAAAGIDRLLFAQDLASRPAGC